MTRTSSLLTLAALLLAPGLLAQPQTRYLVPRFTPQVVSDQLYGANLNPWTNQWEALKLDIYDPQGDTELARPVYLHIHGGEYFYGTKTNGEAKLLCNTFCSLGYVAISIDYRLSPTANHGNKGPDVCAEDAKAAVRWLRRYASQLRIDPDRILVGGDSSGGTASFTVGYTTWPGNSGNPGFSHKPNSLLDMWSIAYATVNDPTVPLCIVHGTADLAVPFAEAQRIQAEATANKVPNTLIAVVGGGHSMWDRWGEFAPKMVSYLYEALRLSERSGLSVRPGYASPGSLTIDCAGWENTLALLCASPNPANVPFPPLGTILIDPTSLVFLGALQHPANTGTSILPFTYPVPGGLSGQFHLQCFWSEPVNGQLYKLSNRGTVTLP